MRRGGVFLRIDTDGTASSLQQRAKHPETFAPHVISFSADQYEALVRTFRLPFRAIEGTAVVGPFFWCALDQDDENPHLQIVFRKSDVRKRGLTRGWELMLSHEFATGLTMGFAKGTDSSDMLEAIVHLRACAGPRSPTRCCCLSSCSATISAAKTTRSSGTRASGCASSSTPSHTATRSRRPRATSRGSNFDLDQVNRDLVECHSQVLWKRPQAYLEIIREIELGMDMFKDRLAEEHNTPEVDKLHRSLLSRLEFYRAKLKGIENYAFTTLARLDLQRSAVGSEKTHI